MNIKKHLEEFDSSKREGYEVSRDLSNDLYLKIGLTNSCKAHYHKQLEVLYILKGIQNAKINNIKYALKEGDLVVVNPYELHEYSDEGAVSFVLCIPSRFLDFFYEFTKGNKFCNNYIEKSEITANIYALMTNLMNVCGKNDLIIYANTLFLLSALVDNIGLTSHLAEEKLGVNAKIKDYIDKHYSENITLDDIAKFCCYSKYYISKSFNKAINCNINDYINLKRIEAFVQLEYSNTANISQNALAVGFNSARAFYSAFNKLYHMTPKEYLSFQKSHTPSETK